MKYRIVFAMEVFVDADTPDEAREKWEHDEVSVEPSFCYLLTVEPQEKENE